MCKVYDYFTGLVNDYDPKTAADEWIVCSIAKPGKVNVGHSCHNTFASAKLAQFNLFLKHGIEAWLEHIPAMGPLSIEDQLDADIHTREMEEHDLGRAWTAGEQAITYPNVLAPKLQLLTTGEVVDHYKGSFS